MNRQSAKQKIKENFGIQSTGYKKTAEIILDLKTAKLFKYMFENMYSIHPITRENLKKCLSDHIEACSE